MTQKTNPWTFDVRVRERNLKAGTITDKDVEKYVAGLPDLAGESEAFGTSQPALLQPPQPEPMDLADDEDDEDDEDGADGADERAAEVEAPAAGGVEADREVSDTPE